jgi:hypothetical protein
MQGLREDIRSLETTLNQFQVSITGKLDENKETLLNEIPEKVSAILRSDFIINGVVPLSERFLLEKLGNMESNITQLIQTTVQSSVQALTQASQHEE